jgi:ketosteroid isomerase-like protein
VSEENLAVVRSIHAAWLAGERADDWMSRDIEYVNPDYAVEPGTVRGPEAFQRVYEIWADFRFEPERLLAAGPENVVAIGTAHAGPSSPIPVSGRLAYIWTIRDGCAVRFRWFRDVSEAIAEAGLPAEAAEG